MLRTSSLIMLIAVLSVCCVNKAPAAVVVFQDDFESNTTVSTAAWPDASGDFDPDNAAVGNWGVVETGDLTDVQVSSYVGGAQPTTAHSGDNYLIAGWHWETYGEWNHGGLPVTNLASLVSNEAVVDFWVWGWDGMVNQIIGRETADAGGDTAFYMYLDSAGVSWHDGATWVVADATWTAGIWNHIVIDLDLIDDTGVVTINDAPPETFVGRYGGAPTLGSIKFDGDTTAYYEDIMVATPEPATLMLLCLGGLGLISRRRA